MPFFKDLVKSNIIFPFNVRCILLILPWDCGLYGLLFIHLIWFFFSKLLNAPSNYFPLSCWIILGIIFFKTIDTVFAPLFFSGRSQTCLLNTSSTLKTYLSTLLFNSTFCLLKSTKSTCKVPCTTLLVTCFIGALLLNLIFFVCSVEFYLMLIWQCFSTRLRTTAVVENKVFDSQHPSGHGKISLLFF